MPATIDVGSVPFNEAIDYFKGKLNVPSSYWNELSAQVHAKAFTVAGATKASLLDDLRLATEDAINNGISIGEFRQQFDDLVAKHGWDFKGGRNWRTRVIYDTNLRTAHMAGRWKQIQRMKERRPFMQYMTAGDERVRPEHRVWNKLVLSVDDDFWNTHYPPNGWGCRCAARSLSLRQITREKLDIGQAPAVKRTDRINTRTGEIFEGVPEGIDPGWDYNVGKAWLGPDTALGEHVMRMPEPLRNQVLKDAKKLAPLLSKEFNPWVKGLSDRSKPLGEIKTIGYMSPAIINAMPENQLPATALITGSDKNIMTMLDQAKDNKYLPADVISNLPESINNPVAILRDKRTQTLLYIFNPAGKSGKQKAVVRVNYKPKPTDSDGKKQSTTTNTLATGGLVDTTELKNESLYELIEGKL